VLAWSDNRSDALGVEQSFFNPDFLLGKLSPLKQIIIKIILGTATLEILSINTHIYELAYSHTNFLPQISISSKCSNKKLFLPIFFLFTLVVPETLLSRIYAFKE